MKPVCVARRPECHRIGTESTCGFPASRNPVAGSGLTGGAGAVASLGVPRSVVCISRAWGAGGEDVGRLVAERLGFAYVDEEIITRAAERGGLDPDTVADQEQRKSLFAGLLAAMAEGGASAAFTPIPTAPAWNEPRPCGPSSATPSARSQRRARR
jgi:hypothetical protein